MQVFEGGTKEKAGCLNVLNLRGTWREMGRQYGALMKDELRHVYECGFVKFTGSGVVSLDKARLCAEKLYANYPFRFKEVLRGIGELSGLTPEQVILVNANELICSSLLSGPQCSGVAAWSDYTAGPLVYGRNYDYVPFFADFADDLSLVCYHPSDGSLASAFISWAGSVFAVNAMNERKIFMEFNNGMPSGGDIWYDSRVPSVAMLMGFMFDCSTLDEFESCMQTARANFSCIVGVADGQTARCFEWPTFGVKRRISHTRPGLTVLTNHFTEPSWGLPRPDDGRFWSTRTRRQNLLNLTKHFKGAINEKVMMDIMDTRLEDLGATTALTRYQLTVVPEEFKLWFKVPGRQEWTLIDMRSLLEPRG